MLVGEAGGTTLARVLLPEPSTMTELMWLAIFAISFDFISGYTGYLSFGHSLFFGTGMFFVLIARNPEALAEFGITMPFFGPETGFMTLVLAAMVFTFFLTILKGLVSFQLTGVYFAMITLGFAEIAKLVMLSLFGDSGLLGGGDYYVGVPFVRELHLPILGAIPLQLPIGRFGGATLHLHDAPVLGSLIGILDGLPLIGGPIGSEITLQPQISSFYLLGVVALLAYFSMQRILHSPFGRVMIAIRENEERARAIGYSTYWYKNVAFAISGAFGALAGALAAGYRNTGNPGVHFDVIQMSGDALLATIIGGMGTLAGPFYGFLFDLNLAEIFGGRGNHGIVRYLESSFASLIDASVGFGLTLGDLLNRTVQGYADLYIGIIFILFILYVPGGLLGTARALAGDTIARAFPRWLDRRIASLSRLMGRFR